MPGAGRVKDNAQCTSDAHGCPGCTHVVTGPAVGGSQDVLINGRPALRAGDPGIHAACCGPNTWQAAVGSPNVFINNKPVHRLGDMTTHCGGVGKLIEASTDVLINDGGPTLAKATTLMPVVPGPPGAGGQEVLAKIGEALRNFGVDQAHKGIMKGLDKALSKLNIPAPIRNKFRDAVSASLKQLLTDLAHGKPPGLGSIGIEALNGTIASVVGDAFSPLRETLANAELHPLASKYLERMIDQAQTVATTAACYGTLTGFGIGHALNDVGFGDAMAAALGSSVEDVFKGYAGDAALWLADKMQPSLQGQVRTWTETYGPGEQPKESNLAERRKVVGATADGSTHVEVVDKVSELILTEGVPHGIAAGVSAGVGFILPF